MYFFSYIYHTIDAFCSHIFRVIKFLLDAIVLFSRSENIPQCFDV
jgi:hypothetical protein